ncbi:MAG: non-homologous end-joining DNA ligase [Pirellulales bacterium]|nr:non-homologous end-joining DNA ligase [Pirellulales bacterium]
MKLPIERTSSSRDGVPEADMTMGKRGRRSTVQALSKSSTVPDRIVPQTAHCAAPRGRRAARQASPAELKGAHRAALPARYDLQLATLALKPPDASGWLHEIKLDGYRMLARIESGRVRLISRNHLDWTGRFAPLVKALEQLPVKCAALDGEVVIYDNAGVSDFQALQNAFAEPKAQGRMTFCVFDLLYWDGYDLRDVPLVERKRALAEILDSAPSSPRLQFCAHLEQDGELFLREACKSGLEGIISKRADSRYVGRRSTSWLKIKCRNEQEFVIGGYTEPSGSRVGFGALLLGYYEAGSLRYAGRVGTGFDTARLRELIERLRQIEQRESPFADLSRGPKGTHWVKPALVAQVSFGNWTGDHLLRQPVFHGLREDKSPLDVGRERATTPREPGPRRH